MELWFYLASSGDWVDKFIAIATLGPFSHVEMYFPNRLLTFSSSARDGGCRAKMITFNPQHWIRKGLTCSAQTAADIFAWCETQRGRKYDYLGALIGPWFGWKHDDELWYCSEICSAALRDFGVMPDLPHHLSPNTLWHHVVNSKVAIEL
jgi:hypothetical protein